MTLTNLWLLSFNAAPRDGDSQSSLRSRTVALKQQAELLISHRLICCYVSCVGGSRPLPAGPISTILYLNRKMQDVGRLSIETEAKF